MNLDIISKKIYDILEVTTPAFIIVAIWCLLLLVVS